MSVKPGTVLRDRKVSTLVVAVVDGQALCVQAPKFRNMAIIAGLWSKTRIVASGIVRVSDLDKAIQHGRGNQ